MNPEKNSPKKFTPETINAGLSKQQQLKILYECELLSVTPQQLLNIAPHLFNEGVTSANTLVTKQPEQIPTPATTSEQDDTDTDDKTSTHYLDDDYGYYPA